MPTLFTDDLPVVSTDEELAALKARHRDCDEYYIASGAIPDRRKRFDQLFRKFEPYADSHFLQEVRTQFHQRTWEMYLTCVLLEHGCAVTSSDEGPDIRTTTHTGQTVWIECVAPKAGAGRDRVPALVNNTVQDVPEEQMLLRLTAALQEKFKKYEEYLKKGPVRSDDIFVIAVNRGAFSHPDSTIPLILKCLFAVGHLAIPISPDGVAGQPYYSRREGIKKKGGATVPMNFFEDQRHAGISAVIYSNTNVLNHPPTLGTDCVVVLNPLATTLLPEDTFGFLDQRRLKDDQIVKV